MNIVKEATILCRPFCIASVVDKFVVVDVFDSVIIAVDVKEIGYRSIA